MVSNVYLHFFDESRLCDDVVWGGMGSYGIVRRSTLWYRILQSGTEWYGVVRRGTCWYEVVWGCTKWCVVVRSGMVLFVVARCYTGQCGTGWFGFVRDDTV